MGSSLNLQFVSLPHDCRKLISCESCFTALVKMYVVSSIAMVIFSCCAVVCSSQYNGRSYVSSRPYDSSMYPKLSIDNSYRDDTESDTDKAVQNSSRGRVSQGLKLSMFMQILRIGRISSYIALGYLVFATVSTHFQGNIPIIDTVLGMKHVKEQNQLLLVENESLKQIKKEQDEIWQAILNIHNTQNDIKSLAESNAALISEWKSTLTNLELQLRRSLEDLTQRLDDLDRGMNASNEDTVEKIRRLQQQWDSEMKSIRASIISLQQEIPAILKDHDKIITSKFQLFQDDMKKIIAKGSSRRSSKRK